GLPLRRFFAAFRVFYAVKGAREYNDSRGLLNDSANPGKERGSMNHGSRREAIAEREAQRARADREELAERIAQTVREDGVVEPMKGLVLRRSSSPTEPVHGVADPAFCVIAQGNKEIVVGEERYRYDSAHYLLNTVELPVASQVIAASRERPYLSLRLNL